ncbi:MAG: hypothetical protein E3J76_05410 [Candidatus Aminicenantes bacterium]|nr:MAG: hypothetical protein E3J76_05410 [Candidatus Aminicenantes bacterium]
MGESSFSPEKGIYYKSDGPEGGPGSEQDYLQAQSQERFRAGYSLTEVLKLSEKPNTIRLAAGEFMGLYEDIGLSTENFRSRFDLGRVVSEISDRTLALSLSHRELQDWEVVTKIYEDNTGEVEIPGFALGERKKKIERRVGHSKDKDGKIVREDWREIEQIVPYIGTEKEREEARKALKDARVEVVVAGVLHDAYVFHDKNSENLAGLGEIYLHHLLTGEALEKFFNSPAVWPEGGVRTEGGVELKSVGEMYDTALRIWEIAIGLSEKPNELQSFRERPGWQYLFPGSTKDTPSKEELRWIGDVSKWHRGYEIENEELVEVGEKGKGFRKPIFSEGYKDDLKRELEKIGKEGDMKRKKEIEKELREVEKEEREPRGLLTEFGNIIAHTHEYPNLEQLEELREEIRRFLGGGEGATPQLRRIIKRVEERAFRFSRVWGMADGRGWEIYLIRNKEGKPEHKLQMDMGPGIGSDYLKIMKPTSYRWKNAIRRRDAGPVYTSARYKSFMEPLTKTLSYKDKIEGYSDPQERTIEEWLWGYPEKEVLVKEPAHRYGEIKWRKFGNYAESAFFLRSFMMAREKVGVYDLTRKADWTVKDLYEMINHDWWEQYMKRIDVGLTKSVVAKGALRGKDEGKVKDKTVALCEGIIRGTWDGVRSSKIYKSLLEEGYKEIIPGTNVLVDRSTIDEIKKVVKDLMGIELETNVISLEERQTRKPFWEKDIKEYQYPYPDYVEIE